MRVPDCHAVGPQRLSSSAPRPWQLPQRSHVHPLDPPAGCRAIAAVGAAGAPSGNRLPADHLDDPRLRPFALRGTIPPAVRSRRAIAPGAPCSTSSWWTPPSRPGQSSVNGSLSTISPGRVTALAALAAVRLGYTVTERPGWYRRRMDCISSLPGRLTSRPTHKPALQRLLSHLLERCARRRGGVPRA